MVQQVETAAASAAPAQQPVTERLLSQIKAQPAKTGLTALLVCVLLVLLARAGLGPKTAVGGVPAAVPAAVAADPVLATPETLLKVTIPPIPAIRVPAAGLPLPRDIFTVDIRRFPKAGGRSDEGTLELREAEGPAAAETTIEQLRRQVAGFRLEGTVTGPASAAFIDGQSVHEGEPYRGFRVTRITSQAVELERDGMRLELRMPEN